MFKSSSLFVILLAVCPALSLKPYDFVTYVLKQADIIPDIISANPHFHPQAFLFATLPVGPLLLGNTLNKTSSLTPPNISFTPMQAPTHELYTIVMADPDAPSRDNQSYSAYRHWLTTGVKPPKSSNHFAEFTQPDVTPYLPPNPPAGSGSHRYTLLLYREPCSNFSIPAGAIEYGSDFNSRKNWNATAFAETYDLELVAANFFSVSGPSS